MNQVFADTSYWIGLLNPRDEFHGKAVAVSKAHSADRIVTSEMVLTELLNSFADRGPQLRLAAAMAVETLRSSRNVIVIPQTTEQFEVPYVGTGICPTRAGALLIVRAF